MPKIINEDEDEDWLNDMIIAQPSEIIMFSYEGSPPDVSELSSEFTPEPDIELPEDTKHKFDFIQPPIILEDSGSDCMINCVKEQLGINDIVAATGAAIGHPTLKKRFVTHGTTKKTSIASKYLPKIIPKKYSKLPRSVPVPPRYDFQRGKFHFRTAKLTGRIIARWIPFVGWGLLAYDAIKIVQCSSQCITKNKDE